MHWVEINAIEYVKKVQAFYQDEPDPWLMAHKLGLTIEYGREDALHGRVITLSFDTRRSRRRSAEVIRHEIAHYLMRKSGVEQKMLELRGSYEEGLPSIEKVCYHGALVLLIPDSVFKEAMEEADTLPEAIVLMCEKTGATIGEASRRWVYAEAGAKRAALITRGRLIVDAAKSNCWLPVWKYDQLDDVKYELPGAEMLQLPDTFGRDQTLYVAGWP